MSKHDFQNDPSLFPFIVWVDTERYTSRIPPPPCVRYHQRWWNVPVHPSNAWSLPWERRRVSNVELGESSTAGNIHSVLWPWTGPVERWILRRSPRRTRWCRTAPLWIALVFHKHHTTLGKATTFPVRAALPIGSNNLQWWNCTPRVLARRCDSSPWLGQGRPFGPVVVPRARRLQHKKYTANHGENTTETVDHGENTG